jgi:hypothetical protein
LIKIYGNAQKTPHTPSSARLNSSFPPEQTATISHSIATILFLRSHIRHRGEIAHAHAALQNALGEQTLSLLGESRAGAKVLVVPVQDVTKIQ